MTRLPTDDKNVIIACLAFCLATTEDESIHRHITNVLAKVQAGGGIRIAKANACAVDNSTTVKPDKVIDGLLSGGLLPEKPPHREEMSQDELLAQIGKDLRQRERILHKSYLEG